MAATITGIVFNDLNHNGIYDPGEPGIPSAYVVLRNPNGVCTTVQTTASGAYTFTNINIAGTYTIYETAVNPGATCPPTTFGQPVGFTNSSTFRTDTVTVTSTNITNNQTITAANFGHDNPLTFICAAIGYQVATPGPGQNSNFYKINLVTGDSTLIKSNMGYNINAIGYNSLDNMIYGIDLTNTHLLRIAKDGSVTDFGIIPNLPSGGNFIVGDIDNQGHLFLYDTTNDRYYVVDVNQNSPTFGQLLDPKNGYVVDTSPYGNTLGSAVTIADWAWSSMDGYLYSVDYTNSPKVIRIDPTTGVVTSLTTTGLPVIAQAYGAMFMDASGTLYAINNITGDVYRITISGTTATAVLFSSSAISNGNDGAMCPNALVRIDYGDAPDPTAGNGPDDYSTLFANDGPRHQIINGLVLGTQVTSELDAYANTTTNATGDDISKGIQDDGLTVPLADLLTINTTYSLNVKVTNPISTGASANLYGWIDFNKDGIFEGNEAAAVQVVPTSASTQQVTLNFTVPAGITVGHTFVRLRLTTDNLVNANSLAPTLVDTRSIGAANDGEVEDYYLTIREPLVEINKSVDKTFANLGEVLTYTVTIKNPETVALSNVLFTDPLPAGTTYNDNLSVSTGYTGTDPQTGLTITTINPGETVTISWQVKIGNTVPSPNPIPNTSTALIDGGTPIQSNTVYTTVIINNKSVNKTFANVGEVITYTVTITNPGTTAVNNVLFKDPIPLGTTYNDNLSVSTGYTGTDPQTGLTITTINAGETVTISWQVKIGSTVPSPNPIPNAGTVTIPNGTPTPTNTVYTAVIENTKTVNKAFANVGEVITYTVTIKNPGTTAVNNVLFQDSIPSGTTYNDNLSVSTGYTGTDPMTGLTITTINPGQTVTISWQVKIGNTVPSPNPIPNAGTVTIPNGTPTPTNTVYTAVLETLKTVNKTVANVGEVITYTVTITNPGSTAVSNVLFQDPIPLGTTYNDNLSVSTGYTGTDPQTGLTITTINAGQTVTISWQVKIGNTIPNPNPIPNTGTVTIPNGTPTSTNTVYTTVVENTKTVDKSFANVGEVLTYTVTIKNSGTTSINNVFFIDDVPQGTVYNDNLSVSTGYTGTDPQSGLTITTINPGETVTIKWQVKVVDTSANPITNVAEITVPGGPPTPTPPTTTTVLEILKAVNKTFANVGEVITYTVTIKNPGTTAVNNVLFQDSIPNGTTYNDNLSVNVPYTGSNPQTGLTITTINPGQTATIKWDVKIGNTIPNPNPIPNAGTVTIPNGTPTSTNTVYTTVLQNTKSVDKSSAVVGEILTYTATIKNPGTTPVNNVLFTDPLPAGTSYNNNLTVSTGYTGIDPMTGLTITTINPGETVTIKWQVKVVDNSANPITNVAEITVPGGTPTPTPPTTTTVLAILKTVNKSFANIGEVITYTVTINNSGTAAVNNVLFKDPTPAGTTYNDNLSVSTGYTGTDPQTGLTITTINPGQTVTIKWDVKIGNTVPNPNPIPNAGTVTVPNGTPTSTNTVYTTVLENTKSVDKSSAVIGDVLTYTVTIKNPGTTAVNNVLFTDPLPTGTVYNNNLSVSTGYTGTDPMTGLTITTINAGETVTIKWQVKVVDNSVNPITNIGEITIPGGTPTPTPPASTTALAILKAVNKTFANVGEVITYTVTINNSGTTAVNNVLFKDPIPNGTTYNDNLSVSTGYTGTDPQTGLTITTISPGETVTIKWDVKIGDTVPNPNPIPNAGTVTPPNGTPTSTNTVYTTVLQNTKSVDKSSAVVGEILTYTVTVKNPGTTAVSNVLFTDPLPTGTSYNNNLTVSTGYTGTDPQTGLTITTINAGEIVTIKWQVKVIDNSANPITNIAEITVPGGTPTPTPPTTTTVLKILKEVNKAFANVGEVITYTATIENTGTAAVNNVLFKDPIPAGTTYNDNLSVSTGYTGTDPQTGLTITTINAGQTVTISWQVKIGDTVPNPNPIPNTGTVTVPNGTPTPTNTVYTTVLQNTKTADKTFANVGEVITYTATIKNPGTTSVNDVYFIDDLPQGTIYNDNLSVSTGYTGTDPQSGLTITTINAGETVTIKWQVKVVDTSANPITNIAEITVPGGTPTPTPPAVTTVLEILKAVNKTFANVGEVITYTVTIKNPGTTAVNKVLFQDTIPNGTTYNDNLSVSVPYTGTNPQSGLTITTINAGQTATIKWDVKIGNTIPNPNPIPNAGTVTVQNGTPTSTNTVYTTVLQNTKSVDKSSAIVGEVLIYTATIKNPGTTAVNNVLFTDPLPTGTTYNNNLSVSTGYTGTDPQTGLTIIIINPGETVTIRWQVKVVDATVNPITNTATITIPGGTPTPTPPVSTTVLKILKAANKSFANVGEVITYTATIENTGAAAVNNVLFTDPVPSGTTYNDNLSVSTGYTGTDPETGLTITTINPGQLVTIKWDVKISANVPNPNPISNTGTVTIPGGTPIPTNTITTEVNTADLVSTGNFVKSRDLAYADIGDEITYTINVTNTGNTIANNVVIKDPIPNGTSYVSGSLTSTVTITGVPATGIIVTNGIAPGETITLTYKVKVNQIPNPNPIPNTASISYTYTVDPSKPNGASASGNTNTVYTEVSHGEIPPENAIKTVDRNPTTPGDIITYTITAKNTGNVPVTNVIVKDVVPKGTTFVVGSVIVNGLSKPSEDPNAGINVDTINAGATAIISFKVLVGNTATSPLINTADINYSYTVDPNKPPVDKIVPTNEVDTTVLKSSIKLEKVADRTGAVVGDIVRYSILVTNDGEVTLNNIIITDPLSPELQYANNLTINGTSSNQSILTGVNIGSLAIGAGATIAFDAKILSIPLDKTINNTASAKFDYIVSGKTFNGTGKTNEETVKVYNPQLTMTKLSDNANVKVGDTFKYTITAKNTGDISINNVIIKDDLPSEFKVVQITVNGIVVNGDIGTGINIGNLAIGENKNIVLTIEVLADLTDTFQNVATGTGTSITDPNKPPVIVNGEGKDPGVTVYNPKLELVKSVDKPYAIVGDTVTYTVVVTNTGDIVLGNVDLDPIVIYDLLSPSLEFISGSVTVEGISDTVSGIVAGVTLGVLNVGQSKTVTFKAKVISNAISPIENNAQATFGYKIPGHEPETGNSTSNTVDIIPEIAKLEISKESDTKFVVINGTINYTVTIKNTGTLDAYNVIFTDKLPSEVQLIDGSFKVNGTGINNVDLNKGVNIGTIKKGEQAIIKYSVKVIATNCNLKIVNSAIAKFQYKLPNGTTGTVTTTPSETSTVTVDIGISNFKQLSVEENLVIPCEKPDIEEINEVDGDIQIIKCYVIETPILKSNEGQILTGSKLIISGVLNEVVEYTALSCDQPVHSAHYSIPFSTFIVLPENYCNCNGDIKTEVEHIYFKRLDSRTLFTNATILIKVIGGGCK